MPLSETGLKNKVIQFLKKEYPSMWIYKTSDRYTSGIPDLILCNDGLFYAIELKVGKNKPTAIQEYVMRNIDKAGGRVSVCRSIDDIKNFLGGQS